MCLGVNSAVHYEVRLGFASPHVSLLLEDNFIHDWVEKLISLIN